MRPAAPGWRGAAPVAALAVALAIATGAAAQELPDVPAGPARLSGRVVHGDRPEGLAGIEVALYALAADGSPGSRRTVTDAEGRFAFESIANGGGVVYLIGARHAGLPFPGDRVVFGDDETAREIEIVVTDPTEDMSEVRVVQSTLHVSLLGNRLAVSEIHRLRNAGARVVHVAPARRAGRQAALHAELLAGAEEFTMPMGLVPEGAVRQGREFRFWGPLYPGEQEISFRYEVPVAVGAQSLAKRFPSGADRIRILALADGPLTEASGLDAGTVEDQGPRMRVFEGADVAGGFVTQLGLRIPEVSADPATVTLVESQMVLEIDDVALQLKEQHGFAVRGAAVQQATGGELLVRFPLPEDAGEVRFSADAAALGLVQTEDGIGLAGPLQPGSHGLGIAYDLRAGPEGVAFERSFDRRLPLLRVFVADTGVVVESDRLHRRRPVRDADRTYLVYEAFEIEAGERLHIALRALPPRAASRQPARLAALVFGLAAVGFLLAPLFAGGGGIAADDEDEAPATQQEREHLYASIRDLDHDHETGKLDEASWQSLRAELRGRAVALLAEERRGPTADAPAPAPACPACDAAVRPDDRFCARCGQPLGPGAPGA